MAPRDGRLKHASIDSTQMLFRTADGIPDKSRDTDLFSRVHHFPTRNNNNIVCFFVFFNWNVAILDGSRMSYPNVQSRLFQSAIWSWLSVGLFRSNAQGFDRFTHTCCWTLTERLHCSKVARYWSKLRENRRNKPGRSPQGKWAGTKSGRRSSGPLPN